MTDDRPASAGTPSTAVAPTSSGARCAGRRCAPSTHPHAHRRQPTCSSRRCWPASAAVWVYSWVPASMTTSTSSASTGTTRFRVTSATNAASPPPSRPTSPLSQPGSSSAAAAQLSRGGCAAWRDRSRIGAHRPAMSSTRATSVEDDMDTQEQSQPDTGASPRREVASRCRCRVRAASTSPAREARARWDPASASDSDPSSTFRSG